MFSVINLQAKFDGSPIDWGLKLEWGGFKRSLRRDHERSCVFIVYNFPYNSREVQTIE